MNVVDRNNAIAVMFENEDQGAVIQSALRMIALVPAAAIADAINRIDREIAIGPLLDPSAYVDGRLFDNAQNYLDLLRAALGLRAAIQRALDRDHKAARD